MRIATWNVERLKHKSELPSILNYCMRTKADILVLTETDRQIQPNYKFCFDTLSANNVIPELYRDTENRVSIYTNYELIKRYETYDRYTAVCVELKTERGNLIIYGTIMGIFGNREKSYALDLKRQMEDMQRLSALGSICVVGDYNCSFEDDYYYTKNGRDIIVDGFRDMEVTVLTGKQLECIDHIAVSENYLVGSKVQVSEWNLDKSLSDHKGIMAEVTW